MPTRRPAPIPPTDDWVQLRLLCTWPEQETYELIRPVVLFGQSPAERARQTGVSRRSIYRKLAGFVQIGMAGLAPAPAGEVGQRLPPLVRQTILDLKSEHPAFSFRELADICYIRFGHRPHHQTVQRLLTEEGPIPVRTTRRYPPYAQIVDTTERRMAIIRLHTEGWRIRSIAAYLQTNRPRVYETLRRWISEGIAGLADKSRAPKRRIRKADLRAITAVRRLQENPELGEFRIYAALKQMGIDLSPRTCGRILTLNRKLYGLAGPKRGPREPKGMPSRQRDGTSTGRWTSAIWICTNSAAG